ncbi:MAG TPA: histidine kinase [Mucilaginibacter sp.]|nr:histidine kinase [Mucilaginibacter sp.]
MARTNRDTPIAALERWNRDISLLGRGCPGYRILQDFLRLQLIPQFKKRSDPAFPVYLLGAIAIWLLGNLVVWLPAVAFRVNRLSSYAILLTVSLGASLLITIIGEIFFAEQARLRHHVSVTAAELAQLRAQISPHFLFNALNSLYTTAWKEKSEKTADGIQRLGDMMRFMLQENNQEWIALDKELTYLHNYIQIQRIRIDESMGIDVRVDIAQPEHEAVIAPMMLVPFVENAFKHGISQLYPSWIKITLSFNDAELCLKVQNSCHSRREMNPGPEHSGIGLENVKRRLGLIYPGKHTLAITQTAKEYVVELALILW